MSKISKLYISAVTAEKQTASVEMQLSAVENQQNELESWLSKYEGEVDEMLAKDGTGPGMELAGPDQERERTYKLAERLGERLEDMGRDLASMVEEINAANAGLSKTTKADEPVSGKTTLHVPYPSHLLILTSSSWADHADCPYPEFAPLSAAGHRPRYLAAAGKGQCCAAGKSGIRTGLFRHEWEQWRRRWWRWWRWRWCSGGLLP